MYKKNSEYETYNMKIGCANILLGRANIPFNSYPNIVMSVQDV